MYQVGIDVSKKKLDICLLVNGMNGKQKTKVIENNLDSAKTLSLLLNSGINYDL